MYAKFRLTVDQDAKVVFPDICIYCEKTKPDDSVKIKDYHFRKYGTGLTNLGKFIHSEIPICSSCKSKFILRRWSSIIILVPFFIILYLLSLKVFDRVMYYEEHNINFIAPLLVATIPVFIWRFFYPVIFSTNYDPYSKQIDYCFHSKYYADQFAVLNNLPLA